MKRIIALVLTFVLAALCLVSCGGGDSIVGAWTAKEDGVEATFTFTEDKLTVSTMGISTDPVDYTAEDGKLSFELMGQKMEGDYKVDGDKLTITIDGDKQVFTKVED